MKKIILIATALLSIGFSFAQDKAKSNQEVKFGAKGNLNIANFVGPDAGDANTFIGFSAGLFVEIPIAKRLIFQPEVLYSTQGSKTEGDLNYTDPNIPLVAKVTLQLSYINVPLLLKYQIVDKFSLEAGPYIGFLASAKAKVTNPVFGTQTVDVKSSIRSIDFGIGVGMNYEFSKAIFANARYQAGLSKIANSDNSGNNFKNSVIQVGLGFRF